MAGPASLQPGREGGLAGGVSLTRTGAQRRRAPVGLGEERLALPRRAGRVDLEADEPPLPREAQAGIARPRLPHPPHPGGEARIVPVGQGQASAVPGVVAAIGRVPALRAQRQVPQRREGAELEDGGRDDRRSSPGCAP